MHETRTCPLSHKYVQTQANKQKQAILSRLGRKRKDIAIVLPVQKARGTHKVCENKNHAVARQKQNREKER